MIRTSQLTTRPGAGLMLRVLRTTRLAVAVCLCFAPLAAAQSTSSASGSTTADLAQQGNPLEGVAAQILELRMALDGMREQLAASHNESEELRQELRTVRDQLESLRRPSGQAGRPPAAEPPARDQLDALVEEQELLRAKVEDLEQSKVESGSKYHVRLSGLALLNVVSTKGAVDSLDLPTTAEPRLPGESGGTFSAGLRQSLLRLEAFGPTFGGARTSGGLTFDFFGGFPKTSEGANSPLVRLRTATFTLDWKNTSITAGQEVPFFSPRSPTSLASTAHPALSSAGNMWVWTPQIHVEHRIALPNDSTMMVQWGILDSFTEELPADEYNRTATAGERIRIPAQAIRVGWQRARNERVVALGAGAYHSKQDWGFGRTVDAWAATTDWDVPLGRWFALSGELYRGRAIGGLGAGASASVMFDGPATEPDSSLQPVDTAGGWSQLKFKPASRLELNAAFGRDNPFRTRLGRVLAARLGRVLGVASEDEPTVNRNASGFLNVIYQARSNLLFSVEYRRLWTTGLDDATRTADHVSFSTGIAF
ncbi:MAG: hypothetical protein DMF95_25900 [Acidobacteria bacterium]|nr:MAG: hypothetical protein DMF95_25900 [Acidobacteriota bacterium]